MKSGKQMLERAMKAIPKAGMSMHKFIATGGKPKEYNKINKTSALRASSKQK